MALQRTKLADIQQIDGTAASILANASGEKIFLRSIVLHNTDTGAQTVTLYNVPDSAGSLGTPATENQFLKVDLTADETVTWDLQYPIVLTDENDAIFAVADDADVVTAQLLGDIDV